MSRDGHRFKSVARRLQKRFPELKYQQALHLCEKVEPLANRIKQTSPRPFSDILEEVAAAKLMEGKPPVEGPPTSRQMAMNAVFDSMYGKTRTISGRFSCQDPVYLGPREMFREKPGAVCIDLNYAQLEMRLLAQLLNHEKAGEVLDENCKRFLDTVRASDDLCEKLKKQGIEISK